MMSMIYLDKPYYSVKGLAKVLGIHPNTVKNAIKSGHINAFKIGKGLNSAFRIPTSEIFRLATKDYLEKKGIKLNGG